MGGQDYSKALHRKRPERLAACDMQRADAKCWWANEAFFNVIRDKAVINAGKQVAEGNVQGSDL